MATLLYRLGRFSYRRPWRVILVWLILLVGILGSGIALGGQTQDSFDIPGTESQEALDRLEAVFPSVAGASSQVVLVAQDGDSVLDDSAVKAIDELVIAIAKIDGIDSAVSPFSEFAGEAVTADESMAIIRVQFDGPAAQVTDETLAELTATASIGEASDLRVEYGGQVFQDTSFGLTVSEVIGVIFAGLVLFITFGSLLAAGMPLLTALIGVAIAYGGIAIYTAFVTVSSTAPLLAVMIGLAVGIDYSLFILSRHRTQLALGEDPQESAAISVGTAGTAVVFAGVTVIIALLGLLVVGIPFLSVMGVGAAFAVFIAIAVAITLLPAVLGLAGSRLIPKAGSRASARAIASHGEPTGSDEPGAARSKPSMGLRWVRGVMKRPILATIGVVAILGTIAVPALSLDLNVPSGGSQPSGSTQREAYDLITDGFGPGFNGPLLVAIDITQTVDILEDLQTIGDRLETLDGVASVSPGFPDAGLDTAIIQVIPETAPNDAATKTVVQEIRDLAPEIERQLDTPIAVTGATAIGIDISTRLTNALVPFGIVVVGLSILLLMMVFRSVLIPIKAALGFLLSVFASFGVVVAIFQWGWFSDLLGVENPGPILSFLPVLLMAVLFGLAMDYQVFLVSGMREEFVKTGDARFAIERGFAGSARVVTAAALIMFFVFFAFVPEGSGEIKPIALGLAAGIAFDAFLVRMTLVPALMTLFGRVAWWMPRWLGRLLPNVDIEGEHLRDHRKAVEWASGEGESAISADYLVSGSAEHSIGPLSLTVPHGAIVIASGDAIDRRLLAATLGGRLALRSGRAQVVGHPLPSEIDSVRKRVALADIGGAATGGAERSETTVTVGELLAERIELTAPWHQALATRRRAAEWVDRVNTVLGDVTDGRARSVQVGGSLMSLPQLERAVVLAAVAIAENTPVIVLDQFDAFADAGDESTFFTAIARLAAPTTTVVVGTPVPARALATGDIGAREIVAIDLYTLSTEGALR